MIIPDIRRVAGARDSWRTAAWRLPDQDPVAYNRTSACSRHGRFELVEYLDGPGNADQISIPNTPWFLSLGSCMVKTTNYKARITFVEFQ